MKPSTGDGRDPLTTPPTRYIEQNIGDGSEPCPTLLDKMPSVVLQYYTDATYYGPQPGSDGDCCSSSEWYETAMSFLVSGGSASLGGSQLRFLLVFLAI